MLDRLGLILEADHPEPEGAPGELWPDLEVGVVVKQYQPPTADLWRQDTPPPWVRRDGAE